MKNFLQILIGVFDIADTVFSSIAYAIVILILTILVWLGFTGLMESYDSHFIWELAIFAFTFFSLFFFFLKKEKYSFNEYVIAVVPVSALLLIIGIGFIYADFKNGDHRFEQAGVIVINFGMVLLSFALCHTSILICRNRIHNH